MNIYSKTSLERLKTCHEDLQLIMYEVIKHVDITIVEGHRSKEKQLEIFKKGRVFKNNSWQIVNKSNILTNCDGITNISMHNYFPSLAVDYVPWTGKLDYSNLERFRNISFFIRGIALGKGITVRIGCDWGNDFQQNSNDFDLPHIELISKIVDGKTVFYK